MSLPRLSVGFLPLVDAAPLIAAREMGFAETEGLALDLVRAPSWSGIRDMLAYGRVDAAHMLAPLPIARALGLGGGGPLFSAVSTLSVNGTVIGASQDLAARVREAGADFADAEATGRALIAAARGRLRIGVPFPFSMHAELLYYWLSALGLPAPQEVDIRTVPPPMMAEAIGAGEIDAFCVGEPWGSIAVETALGELLLPGAAIWRFAPEKVLAVRTDWTAEAPEQQAALIRAAWRAGRWLAEPANRVIAAEMLSQPDYLDIPAEIIDRALSGRLTISGRGEMREVPAFMEFHHGAATFPWRSQAAWIGRQLAARTGLDRSEAMRAAREVYRTDIHRAALRGLGADLPGASEKVEGALAAPTEAPSESGHLALMPDAFFDRRIFDPSVPE